MNNAGCILVTPGEPAGIGPELAVRAAMHATGEGEDLVLVADPALLTSTAERAGFRIHIDEWRPGQAWTRAAPGTVRCYPHALVAPVVAGTLNPSNARYVLECLASASDCVSDGQAAALVTGPVHKGIINDAGIAFSGHTEFLAERAGVDQVVMMLVADSLRVALATTHLPLRDVADAVQHDTLVRTLEILHIDLTRWFGIERPRIAVLGLNPHAGEGGHLGHEEADVIVPVLERLRGQGLDLIGPLPADTAFVPERLAGFDAVLAMYHDQGLPVLKHAGFGHAVNVTLGLPYIRTSVDHGTALDIAGSGRADPGSFRAALALARRFASRNA